MNFNSLNKVILCGMVASDVMVRKPQEGGTALTRFQISTLEVFPENKQKAEYHSVVCWGEMAKFTAKNLKKGQMVLIEGKLRHYYYEDKKIGMKLKATEVNADSITFIKMPEKKKKNKEKK